MPRNSEYKTEPSNLGVQKLRAIPATLDQIAAAVGSKPTSVFGWRQGTKTPGRKSRESLARAYPDIEPDDWERAPLSGAEVRSQELAAAEVDPAQVSNLESVNRLLRELRDARRDPHLTGTTRERLAARELVALKFREELEQRDTLTQDRVVAAHPEWPRVRDALCKAVAPCADCTVRVLAALRELDV